MSAVRLWAARTLIGPVGAWTQGNSARDRNDRPCDPLDHRACQWCATGALMHVTGSTAPEVLRGDGPDLLAQAAWVVIEAHDVQERVIVYAPVFVNDTLGHDETLAMFDLAIALAEADDAE